MPPWPAGLLHHRDGRFTLPPEGHAVLAAPTSPAAMAGGALLPTGWFQGIDQLTASFRAGTGIAWDRQPRAVHEGTARFFESAYRANLIGSWLPALDGVEQRLRDGITVADVGCGYGASTRLMAEAYPASTFVGYDRHEPSVRAARSQPLPPGLRFEVAAADAYPSGGYGLICMFDTFHDLSDPLAAAAHARKALAADGTLLLVEPAAEDDTADNLAEPMAVFSYAASLFQCLPASLAEPPGHGLGAQAGAQAVRDILLEAGFTDFRIAARTPVNAVYQAR